MKKVTLLIPDGYNSILSITAIGNIGMQINGSITIENIDYADEITIDLSEKINKANQEVNK